MTWYLYSDDWLYINASDNNSLFKAQLCGEIWNSSVIIFALDLMIFVHIRFEIILKDLLFYFSVFLNFVDIL